MIVLPRESAKVPPIIDVRISRSEASPRLEAKLKEIYMTFQAFRDRATLEKCGLDIYMNQSQNSALSYGPDSGSALNNGFWDGFIVFRASSNEGFPRAEALLPNYTRSYLLQEVFGLSLEFRVGLVSKINVFDTKAAWIS
jgi:hypothetical protein